mmetsp:Transcript_52718/g.127675  ORF Transcript_52718/g.127675 Transcript_52718/m.127675 type:complete len:221 (+) Transcript_52718:939-1601(+)
MVLPVHLGGHPEYLLSPFEGSLQEAFVLLHSSCFCLDIAQQAPPFILPFHTRLRTQRLGDLERPQAEQEGLVHLPALPRDACHHQHIVAHLSRRLTVLILPQQNALHLHLPCTIIVSNGCPTLGDSPEAVASQTRALVTNPPVAASAVEYGCSSLQQRNPLVMLPTQPEMFCNARHDSRHREGGGRRGALPIRFGVKGCLHLLLHFGKKTPEAYLLCAGE